VLRKAFELATDPQFALNFEGPLALLTVEEIYGRASVELFQQLKEDRRVERKPSGIQARVLGDYFSMWANTAPDGGLIVVGMTDEGRIDGCARLSQNAVNHLEKTQMEYCPDARFNCKRIEAASDYILVFRVYYRPDKVVKTASSEAFVRYGDSKKKLSADEIRELENDKGQVDFELEPCGLSFPIDFETELVRQFCDRFRKTRGLAFHADTDVLELAHLGKNEHGTFIPNNACALLFAGDPRGKFSGCFIRFFRYEQEWEGTGHQYNATKDEWIRGNITAQIIGAERVLDSQLREFSRLGTAGKFYTAPEYPKPAWYEAIVNACVHRSYSLRTMNIFVKMFDDRLEVESPGGFPPLVTPANIYDIHKPRNPYLMEALYYLDFVKCAHEGARRIRSAMADLNLPAPDFIQSGEANSTPIVKVVLRNNVKHRKVWVDSDAAKLVGESVMKQLTQDELRAINFVAEHGAISVSDLQRLTGRTWPSAKKLLMGLVDQKLLDHQIRTGPDIERDPQARFTLRKPNGKEN
jgi:ATP-dependent DNA helicase RecG